jgi:hypothetical protein
MLMTALILAYVDLTAAQDASNVWLESFEAVAAAGDTHIVLYEDEKVRVLEVTTHPGDRGEMHGHRWPSVLIIDSLSNARDHLLDGSVIELDRPPEAAPYPVVLTYGPEAPHSFENVDTIPFHLYRIEFKTIEFRNIP